MRILAFSDTHGDIDKIKKLADLAEKRNVDLVVMCGDFTIADKIPPYVISPFLDKGKRVVIVPGNHESEATVEFLAEHYGVKSIHGKAVKYEDVGLFGFGGANIGLNQVSDEETFEALKKAFEKISYLKKKIMVTHVHPSGSKIERFTRIFPGSRGVRKAVDKLQPDILLCGHVHEAEGIEEIIGKTKVINVSKNGKIIEV